MIKQKHFQNKTGLLKIYKYFEASKVPAGGAALISAYSWYKPFLPLAHRCSMNSSSVIPPPFSEWTDSSHTDRDAVLLERGFSSSSVKSVTADSGVKGQGSMLSFYKKKKNKMK